MASTSTSASLPTHSFEHHVFLSFRGEDTRHSFISHLHSALCQKSIRTFIDNELRSGEEISQRLLNAIEESMFAVVVFSKGYASSRWCLDELAKIVECIDTRGQKLIPVFYHADPSDVRKQIGTFAEAFVRHEANFNSNIERLQRWRAALTKAANISGWATKDCRSESDIVDGIVRRIWKDVQKMWPSPLKDLVGICPCIEQLQTFLFNGSSGNVFILGLWGMGGIGKTTIAKALLGQIKCRFEKYCFLENVREESEKRGLEKLGKKLLFEILEEKMKTINMPDIGQFFYMRRGIKVLLVLDDVDDRKQLEYLAGDRGWYGPGSRIIITSRDRQLLKPLVDEVYEVKPLLQPDDLQLFSMHAFKQNVPTDYMRELSSLVVRYAQGVPLALKVLGSFLFGKSKREWESKLKKLKNAPEKTIQGVLRSSYSSLDKEQKELFLWIACCFKGGSKDLVVELLNDCGISTEIGLSVLVDKSLITLFNYQNEDGSEYEGITMHDLLQEMGREIVREESEDPGERRWLWNHEDIYQVLRGNSGTKKIKGIKLYASSMKEVQLHPDTFARMSKLKCLGIVSDTLRLPRGISALPDELRYLSWYKYPSESLPANFNPVNLIQLRLPRSEITELFFDEKQVLGKLRVIELQKCEQLCKISILSSAPNVTEICLAYCTKLRSLSDLSDLTSLTRLDLTDCSNIETFPKVPRSTKVLRLRGTAIKEVPSSIKQLSLLESLDIAGCKSLRSLPELPQNLDSLTASGCTSLKTFPANIEQLSRLETLDIAGCKSLQSLPELPQNLLRLKASGCMSLETIPASIKQLSRLGTLNIAGCKSLQSLPELPQNLLQLKASGCMSLETIPASIKQLSRLGTLNIEGCKSLQSLPELPQNLLRIEASGCMSLETIPASIKQLSRLETLDIAGCKSLQSLPELPQNLLRLEASGCTSLETIYAGIKQLSRLETLDIAGCKSLKSIQELPQNLLRLKASGCTSLETISAAFTRLVFGSRNSSQQCVFDFDEKECGDTVCDLHTNFITNGHRYKAFGATPQVSIIYTGSKVPGYINHQSIGDSINFEFSSNWLNNGFLGFALGFVYKPGSIAECRHHCFHYVLFIGDKCMSDSGLGSSIGSLIPNDTEAEHVFVKFDHELRDMILRNACKSQSCHDVFLLKFRSECCCKIKMCGVIPLYAQGQGHNTLQLLPLGGHAKAALENKRCQEDKPPSMSQFDADEPGQNHGSREMDEGLPRPKKLELFQHVTASTLAEWGSMLSL